MHRWNKSLSSRLGPGALASFGSSPAAVGRMA